jgi:hypothetical protein
MIQSQRVLMSIDWDKLDDCNPVIVPGRPEFGLWTVVRTFITGPQIIRVEATGEWCPIAGMPPCSADGFRHWAFGREHLMTDRAPIGALIAKIGGSNLSAQDSDILVIGSLAVFTVPEKVSGPLYLTINDAVGCFDDNSGELKVKIS